MARKWTRANDVVWEELDGGALLVDAKTGARWTLNATATALWRACDGKLRLSETRAEVRAFLRGLSAQHLLAPVTEAGGSVMEFSAFPTPPMIQTLGLGHGPRTRPGPRGNSSPG